MTIDKVRLTSYRKRKRHEHRNDYLCRRRQMVHQQRRCTTAAHHLLRDAALLPVPHRASVLPCTRHLAPNRRSRSAEVAAPVAGESQSAIQEPLTCFCPAQGLPSSSEIYTNSISPLWHGEVRRDLRRVALLLSGATGIILYIGVATAHQYAYGNYRNQYLHKGCFFAKIRKSSGKHRCNNKKSSRQQMHPP